MIFGWKHRALAAEREVVRLSSLLSDLTQSHEDERDELRKQNTELHRLLLAYASPAGSYSLQGPRASNEQNSNSALPSLGPQRVARKYPSYLPDVRSTEAQSIPDSAVGEIPTTESQSN